MMRRIYFFIFILLIVSVNSQTNNDLNPYFKNFPNSPTSATFLRYGEIQNSEFTGSNTQKIPIHTVKSGDIVLPISLDYIGGNGIKVADEGSSVGIGWNLGLPAIVQSVLGSDDLDFSINKEKILLHYQPETPWGLLNYDKKYLESKDGVAIPSGYIDAPQIGKYTYYYSVNHTVPIQNYFKELNNGIEHDASPDIFILNLSGEKIEFFISNHELLDGVSGATPIFTSLKKGYTIDFDKGTFSFTVTAPNGISYTFDKREEAEIYSVINRNFVLTKITDRNNNTVYISYNQYNGSNFIPQSKNLNYTIGYNNTNNPGCQGIPFFWGNQYCIGSKLRSLNSDNDAYASSGTDGTYGLSTNIEYNSYQNYLLVSSIKGDFGEIRFEYSNREDKPTAKLDKISIIPFANSQAAKNFNFHYNYWIADNNYGGHSSTAGEDRMRKRLFLTELIINMTEKYQFSYFDGVKLPRKDSYAVDYWGYFNGGINNQTYFLNPQDFSLGYINQLPVTNLNNNKKTADLNYATSGMLKKIIYPTKGYSDFNYELNEAGNLFVSLTAVNQTHGKGLRLESQTNYGMNAEFLEKTKFLYEEGYSTNPLDLVRQFTNKKILIQPYAPHQFTTATLISMNATNNYSPSSLSSGDFVGYGKVTKIEVDENNINKGKIVSTYNINPDVFYHFSFDQMPVPIPSTKNTGTESGKLLSQSIYDNNSLIKKVENQYDTKYSSIYYGTIFSPISEWIYVCKEWVNSGGGGGWASTPDVTSYKGISVVAHYPIFSKESLISSTKTTEYLNNQALITTTNFSYDQFYNLLTEKNTTTSTGQSIVENFDYTAKYPRFYTKNILSDLVLKQVTKNNKVIFKQDNMYENTLHFNPTSIKTSRLDNNLSSTSNVDLQRYDNKGNLLQYSEKSGSPVSIVWGYYSTLPIAKVEGATYPDPNNPVPPDTDIPQNLINSIVNASNSDTGQLPSSDESAFLTALDNFRKDPLMQKFRITTYTYDPIIGVRSITPSSGIREVYLYDSNGRLKEVRENNNNGKILKEFSYNYAPVKYFNVEKSKTFTRNNCGSGYQGGAYTYTVSANKYSSYVSQADADQQAQNDIDANGQTAANTYGTCTYLVDCGFTPNSIIPSGNVLTKSVKLNGSTVNFNLSFSPQNVSATWSNPTLIGYIPNPGCRPAANIYSSFDAGNNSWDITTQPNGNVTIKLTGGSVNPTTFLPPITIVYSYTK